VLLGFAFIPWCGVVAGMCVFGVGWVRCLEQVNGDSMPKAVTWKDHRLALPESVLRSGQNVVEVAFSNCYDRDGAGLHTFTDPVDEEVR